MALADPQVVTVNSVAKSMPRLASVTNGPLTVTTYQKDDSTFTLEVKHLSLTKDKKKRVRSTATFVQRAIVPDPLTAQNDYETCSISFQFERPEAGFTSAQVTDMVTGLKTWFDSTMVGKMYGRES